MAKSSFIPPQSYPLADSQGRPLDAWWKFWNNLGIEQKVVSAADIGLSYPTSLTITGLAATASVTISSHVRQFPSGAVTYPSGTITGLSYGVSYWIYDDGGYKASITALDAFASPSNPSRVFVGAITMPATSGASNTTGNNALPPGYVDP